MSYFDTSWPNTGYVDPDYVVFLDIFILKLSQSYLFSISFISSAYLIESLLYSGLWLHIILCQASQYALFIA